MSHFRLLVPLAASPHSLYDRDLITYDRDDAKHDRDLAARIREHIHRDDVSERDGDVTPHNDHRWIQINLDGLCDPSDKLHRHVNRDVEFNDHNVKSHERENRWIKVNLYGLGDRDRDLVLLDDEAYPGPAGAGAFSDIPAHEFSPDSAERPSVKKDLSAGAGGLAAPRGRRRLAERPRLASAPVTDPDLLELARLAESAPSDVTDPAFLSAMLASRRDWQALNLNHSDQ